MSSSSRALCISLLTLMPHTMIMIMLMMMMSMNIIIIIMIAMVWACLDAAPQWRTECLCRPS